MSKVKFVDEPPSSHSKYAALFEELHDPATWEQWVEVDTVSGGGLASRLRNGSYVAMRDLRFDVRQQRVDGQQRVLVKVIGRRKR